MDSIVVYDTIPIIGAEVDTTFKKDLAINWDSLRNANPDMFPEYLPCPELPPVMEVKKGKASAILKQTKEGLDVKVKCEPDTIYYEKKVLVPVEVNNGWSDGRVILVIIGALVVGAGIMRLFR